MAGKRSLRRTPVRSLNDPATLDGLRIVLRATDQLLANPQALLAFRRAAARWERRVETPVTAVIDVDYGPELFGTPFAPNVLGATFTAGEAALLPGDEVAGPAEIVAALKARHPDDAQLQALYDAIPLPTPSSVRVVEDGDTTTAFLDLAIGTRLNLQALGFLSPDTDPDPDVNVLGDVPLIGFNAGFSFDLDPSDGISPGLTDFDAVAVHEIGHALGFDTAVGSGGPPDNLFYIWDLFRVRPEAVTPGQLDGFRTAERIVTPGPPPSDTLVIEQGRLFFAPEQVFFDGLQERPLSTATPAGEDGDNRQGSHWQDDDQRPPSFEEARLIGIMDPTIPAGVREIIKDADLRVLEVIGYEIDYAPAFARLQLAVDDAVQDLSLAPDTLQLGEVEAGAVREVPVRLTNLDLDEPLVYRAEVELVVVQPDGALAEVALDVAEGTVPVGEAATLLLAVGNAPAPGVFEGVLRIETNDTTHLVVEVPFEFSSGGATAPALILRDLDEGRLGDFGRLAPDDVATRTFALENGGNLDLTYRIVTGLSARSFPFDATPDTTFSKTTVPQPGAQQVLARFFGTAAEQAEVLYETDFEADFGGFVAGGSFPGDWQRVTLGAAELDGHSVPTAAYFGQPPFLDPETGALDSLRYRNNAVGRLVSPPLDLSAVPLQDLVVLTFNYYLKAEEGFDFATVLVSFDGGEDFEEVASSDDGLLQNDGAWHNAMIVLPEFSGFPDSVKFAFQFISDTFVVDEGWYVDDVRLYTVPGQNPIFTTPRAGVITEAGGTETVSVSVNAGALEDGFYSGMIRVLSNDLDMRSVSVPFTFTLGSVTFPTLTTARPVVEVAAPPEAVVEETLTFVNAGDEPLSFVRLLEPALSSFFDSEPTMLRLDVPLPRSLQSEAPLLTVGTTVGSKGVVHPAATSEDSLFSVALPDAGLPVDLTQLPDGRVLVVDADRNNGGQTFVLSETLELLKVVDGFTGGSGVQVSGIAYNDRSETLWIALLQTFELIEARLVENGFQLTGRSFGLFFPPIGMAYSAALDAFFMAEFGADRIWAVGTDGRVLPGYPVAAERTTDVPGLSITGGVLETGLEDLQEGSRIAFAQRDQFARAYAENDTIEVSPGLLGGSLRINGLLRSRLNPNGVFYYLTNPSDVQARVVAVDPPDLPGRVFTFVKADEPMFVQGLLPGAEAALDVRVSAEGLGAGTIAVDTLAFLTNNPEDRVARVPVRLDVTEGVAVEDAAERPSRFALHPNYPNPFNPRTTLRFDLAAPAAVTLSVYDVLGRRVAFLLRDAALEAGTHRYPFLADGLSSGVYLIRLEAGVHSATRRMVLLK